MSGTESAETLTLYQMSVMTVCTAGLLIFGFHIPQWGDALMLALSGVGNGIAQIWWTRSLSSASRVMTRLQTEIFNVGGGDLMSTTSRLLSIPEVRRVQDMYSSHLSH